MEMIHNMLKYSEVTTDLRFVSISITYLELRPGIELTNKKLATNNQIFDDFPEDGAYVGVVCDHIRSVLPRWKQLTDTEVIVIKELNTSTTPLDKISQFSIRPSEFRALFDQVGNYYRWFTICRHRVKLDTLINIITIDLSTTAWVDGLQRVVKVKKRHFQKLWSTSQQKKKILSLIFFMRM